MEKRQVNPTLKAALEYGPLIGFLVAYFMLKDDVFAVGGTEYKGFIVVTAGFIPVFLLTLGALWWLTGHLSKMQLVTAVLIVVFGGLTVWLNDDRFFKMKPTMIYLLFGGALGIGLLRGESWLQAVMEGLVPLEPEGWMILTKRIMALFFGLAVMNELIWRNLSEETWVLFKFPGLPLAVFVFFISQVGLFKRYGTEETESE